MKKFFGIFISIIVGFMFLPNLGINSKLIDEIYFEKNKENSQRATEVYWTTLAFNEDRHTIYGEFMLDAPPNEQIIVKHYSEDFLYSETFTPQVQNEFYSFITTAYYAPPIGSLYYETELFEVYDGEDLIEAKEAAVTNFDASKIVSSIIIDYVGTNYVILNFLYDPIALGIASDLGFHYSLTLHEQDGLNFIGEYDLTTQQVQSDFVISNLEPNTTYFIEFMVTDTTTTEHKNTDTTFTTVEI